MNYDPLIVKKAVDLLLQKSVTESERKRDYHAGPGESFPLGPAGQHLQAAWDLAGHAANPDEVRRHIIAFAHEHGLMAHLPQSAHDWMRGGGKTAKKAKNSDIQDLYQLAWNHESMEGDDSQKRRLIAFAHTHETQHLLPEEAHGMMHEMMVPHNHDGVTNDENGYHVHTVVKAFNPVALEGLIVKSWDVGDTVHFEGWLSTPRKDGEKDVTEPEAFLRGMEGYFSRRAPLSIEHLGKNIPIGHLQKAASIRDGKVLKAASHPTDPTEFEYLPASGTGTWVSGVVNEEPGISAIRKGNVGGMSFIANATKYEPLPGGRYRYLEFDPWIESTIAAYPINPDAVIAVAKAFGLKDEETMPLSLEEIFAEAAKQVEAEKQAQNAQGVTKAELGSVLGEFKTALLTEVQTEVKKAVESAVVEVQKALPQRGDGVGRKGQVSGGATQAPTFEDDPANYIVQKAQSVKDEDYDTFFTAEEKHVMGEMTLAALLLGLN